MSEYQLKSNEKLNGGYTLQIGDFTLRILGGYAPSWEKVYDTENSFTNYDGSEYKVLKGIRFSLKIDIGHIPTEYFSELAEELKKSSVMLKCPDFEGECRCDNIPAELKQASFLGVRYGISFTLTAKNLISDQGGGGEFYSLTIDGNDFPRYEGVKIMQNADGYGISGVCMSEMTFSVPLSDYERYTIPSSAKVEFKLSGIIEFAPAFYISSRSRKGEKVSFKCCDRIMWTEQVISISEELFDANAEYGTDRIGAQFIAQYIAAQCGFKGFGTSADIPTVFLPKEDVIGKNCRDILVGISEAWCGFFKTSNGGALYFMVFGSEGIAENTVDKYTEISEGSVKGPIYKIIMTNGSETFESGGTTVTDHLNTLKISTKYASGDLCNQIMSRLNGYTYQAWDCEKCLFNDYGWIEIIGLVNFPNRPSRTANYITKIPTPQGIFISCGNNEVTESEFDYSGAISRQIRNKISDGEKLGNNTMVTKYQGIIHLADDKSKAKSAEEPVSIKKFGYSPATYDGVVKFDGAMVDNAKPKIEVKSDLSGFSTVYGDTAVEYLLEWDGDNVTLKDLPKEE